MQSSKSGKLPKMNKQTQEAYNEWLLKYGFSEVPIDQARIDKVYYLINALHNYTRNLPLKRLHTPGKITYQLKTPKELKDENPTKTPWGTNQAPQ